MEYYIVTYRSRSVTVRVYNALRNNGINCYLASTPRSANVGCGLSVKVDKAVIDNFRTQLIQEESFAGFFMVKNIAGKTMVVRV